MLQPGDLTQLLLLPLPVRGLNPLLNGRNLQVRFQSDGPVDLATLAAYSGTNSAPTSVAWQHLLDGKLSPKEHAPSPKGSTGKLIYSRVSGIQVGSSWSGRISDPGAEWLSVSQAPISWPISSLERGSLGTGQIQTAPLQIFYPETAWAAHGNYGVEYILDLPLHNDTAADVQLDLALESPLKKDRSQGGLNFLTTPSPSVMFRGTIEVAGLDGANGQASGRKAFHLVLRSGQQGPSLGRISLGPGQSRQLRVRLIYPADATPPQVLSLLPVMKQSEAIPPTRP